MLYILKNTKKYTIFFDLKNQYTPACHWRLEKQKTHTHTYIQIHIFIYIYGNSTHIISYIHTLRTDLLLSKMSPPARRLKSLAQNANSLFVNSPPPTDGFAAWPITLRTPSVRFTTVASTPPPPQSTTTIVSFGLSLLIHVLFSKREREIEIEIERGEDQTDKQAEIQSTDKQIKAGVFSREGKKKKKIYFQQSAARKCTRIF